jgi:hypothetical protein
MTDAERIELAIRRTSSRLKQQIPWDMAVTEALDMLADEIADSFARPALAPAGMIDKPGALTPTNQ